MKLQSKLSVKNCFGKIKPTVPDGDGGYQVAEENILRVVGVANAIQHGESDFGVFAALIGMFKVTNLKTGEVYSGAKLFLPDVAANMITGALENSNAVEFAFDIGTRARPDLPIGYEYTAESLLDAGNALEALESKLKALPALSAPKADKPAKAAAKQAETAEA